MKEGVKETQKVINKKGQEKESTPIKTILPIMEECSEINTSISTNKKQIKLRKLTEAKDLYIKHEKQLTELIKIEESSQFQNKQEEQQQSSQSRIQRIIKIDDQLVYQELKNRYKLNKIGLSYATLFFRENQEIVIISTQKKMERNISMIEGLRNNLPRSKVESVLELSEKEGLYLQKYVKIEEIQNKHFVKIDFSQTKYTPQKTLVTNINEIEIIIVHGNITDIECKAIVNSCNNKICFEDYQSLVGIAQSIMEMAGNQFSIFCKEYIDKNKELKSGTALTYQMPTNKNINYIINVNTPIYTSGKEIQEHLEIIRKNIEVILQEANKLKLKSIATPILGSGANGINVNQSATTIINELITQILTNNCQLQKIYLVEIDFHKVKELTNIFKNIIIPPKIVRQVKYQWQWIENKKFYNYDDEDINRRIDEAYEKFLNQKNEIQIRFQYPFSKQPGTHLVDLKLGTIIDIELETSQKIWQKYVNNVNYFFIGFEKVNEELNEYLTLQQMNNIFVFEIFYKKYTVIFSPNDGMYQINDETHYKRAIRFQEIKQQQVTKQTQQKNVLLNLITTAHQNKKINCQEFPFEAKQYSQTSKAKIIISSFDEQINKGIKEDLKAELKNGVIQSYIAVPKISSQDLDRFKAFIESKCLRIFGPIESGGYIKLELFKNKLEKLTQGLESLKQTFLQYPSEWSKQKINFVKNQLSKSSLEYQKIEKLFNETDKGEIVAIFRIQNKAIWDNYVNEKNKLKEIYRAQGQCLTALEEERYLWHGVKGMHPSVIYQGIKEAFDQTYSNVGLWGTGIYFAESALYSRQYSYSLPISNNNQLAGNNVMLCCLVTTGRLEVKQPDQNIRRPSKGFDCVTGFTQGSNVFVLYTMDIRRAYPAYEVIFK